MSSISKLAITGASGKIGGAVLRNLLRYNLVDPKRLVIITTSPTSSPIWADAIAAGAEIRPGNYDDPSSIQAALRGVERFLLVSSPRIELDWLPGKGGREAQHAAAIEAAAAAGVKHLYYTSLAFNSDESKAGVMRAHNATERFLRQRFGDGKGKEGMMRWSVLREGIYSESWPLYLGHWDSAPGGVGAERRSAVIAGDGKIAWVCVDDLGLATAAVVADEEDEGRWAGRTVTLSSTLSTEANALSIAEVARLVGDKRGAPVEVEIVPRERHEEHHVRERGLDAGLVRWWASSYEAIADGECENEDGTLDEILKRFGREVKPLEETIGEMLQ